jgi:putative acetyltransferase
MLSQISARNPSSEFYQAIENAMEIRVDDLKGAEVAQLLQEHHEDMLRHSPPESVHALDLSALRAPDVTFWCAWDDNKLAGCGALKALNKTHGEVKSMRTALSHLRQGVASEILKFIIDEAKKRSYSTISLETGAMAAFKPAQELYKRFGFSYCEPFGDYAADPYSVFMVKALS